MAKTFFTLRQGTEVQAYEQTLLPSGSLTPGQGTAPSGTLDSEFVASGTLNQVNRTLVEPIELTSAEVFSPENGGNLINTAISGTKQFTTQVHQYSYPITEEDRRKRRGSTR